MSRSFKKHPITGFTLAPSEKEDKVLAHKKFRKRLKNKLREVEKYAMYPDDALDIEFIDIILPEKLEEVSDDYTFSKDGKIIWTGKDKEKALRK
jgi:hypothetical protein